MRIADSRRLAREHKTVYKMIVLYCRHHHNAQEELCPECTALAEYAEERLQHCKYGVEKPVCSACPTHCYKKYMREKIRVVMRYAGPRMLWHSPFLAIMHLFDKKK